ncbi:MAG TPA: hypothetical protein VFP49_08005 [Nitrososphaeraceae archaeon]|nr:hypothetical protein [Nitrososphaeraceae archaeon]
MKQICFIVTLFAALTIGILLSINSEIIFCSRKNETSEIDDSPLITTAEIDEGLENNTSQMANNTAMMQ